MKTRYLIISIVFTWISYFKAYPYEFSNINNQPSSELDAQKPNLLKVGANISYLNTYNYIPKFRFYIGIAPTLSLSGKTYVKPELALSFKGGHVNYNEPFFDGYASYNLNYLELPLVFGFKPTDKVSFEIGGYGALLLLSNFRFDGDFFYGYGSFGQGEISTLDYGLVSGIVFNTNRLNIGIRYQYGLEKVAKGNTAQTFLGNALNQTIQITFQRNRVLGKLISN